MSKRTRVQIFMLILSVNMYIVPKKICNIFSFLKYKDMSNEYLPIVRGSHQKLKP
jgi:hypothetical protein